MSGECALWIQGDGMGTAYYCLETERHVNAAEQLYCQGVAVLKLQREIFDTYLNRLHGPNVSRGTCMPTAARRNSHRFYIRTTRPHSREPCSNVRGEKIAVVPVGGDCCVTLIVRHMSPRPRKLQDAAALAQSAAREWRSAELSRSTGWENM